MKKFYVLLLFLIVNIKDQFAAEKNNFPKAIPAPHPEAYLKSKKLRCTMPDCPNARTKKICDYCGWYVCPEHFEIAQEIHTKLHPC